MKKEKKKLIQKQYDENKLIIDDFKKFKDVLEDKGDRTESLLTLACAVGIHLAKQSNATSLKLESEITSENHDDFLSAEVEINIKNIKYKTK